jgi:TRAP-type C4-dicarboxylate transport system substrate-binding protein
MIDRLLRLVLLAALLLTLAPPLSARALIIKMGTLAPEGSTWHDGLLKIRQEWRRISQGQVELRIYAGGVLGDEAEMIRQMHRRGLDGVALSGSGLPRLDRSVDCLNLPMLLNSYEELDYVRDRIAPKIESALEEKNYKVLNWSDAGWVHFFSKEPARSLDDIRGMKLWISAGDPDSEKLFKDYGFRAVPLPATDMLTGLQTGLIEAIQVPPLFALLDRTYQYADNMIDLKWVPLVAATVISSASWNRVPAEYHGEMLQAAREAGVQLRSEVRQAGQDAVAEMKSRGLNVVQLDDASLKTWRQEVVDAYPRLRGTLAPAELIDEVIRLRDEYRRSHASAE